jgi:FKBP-type peptidyl-prolyl cis-trans isomerase 2
VEEEGERQSAGFGQEVGMEKAKNGDLVKVHYTGKLEDGTVFDSSADRDPLEFTLGQGEVIAGFEEAVVGMSPGETRTADVDAGKAYGPRREEMVVEVDRTQFPDHLDPQVGQHLEIRQQAGECVMVTVVGVSESRVTLDANHPLAGKALRFEIQLVDIG